VKNRTNPQIFQRDLVGTLPLEIVALVVEYWELNDVVRLRRVTLITGHPFCPSTARLTPGQVSKRWQEVLSSSMVSRAAYRASTGNDVSSIQEPGQFTKLLEKRIRQERGHPVFEAQFNCALEMPPSSRIKLVCCGEFLAWPEEKTEHTSIAIMNLRTGKQDRLLTENRDKLLLIRVSKGFLAAVTIRGYASSLL